MKGANPRSKSNASDAAERAWKRAIRLLTVHDRTERELRERLADQHVSASLIDATIHRLYELHYLDDRRLAQGVAEAARRRGHGSVRARAQLAARGVDEALIEEVVPAAFADETELARRALARRHPGALREAAQRAKAARFLLRQGYPEEVVSAVLGDEVC